MSIQDKFYLWGYTQEKIGTPVPFTATLKSYCSLETAADYLGMPNTVFMNPLHSWDNVEKNLDYLKNSKKIISALPHGAENSVAGAEKISKLSLKYPAIKGIVLDDFNQMSGHYTTVDLIKKIYDNTKKHNPNLEIYVVRYSDVNHLDFEPYLEFIDGFMLWRWHSTTHFWESEFEALVHRLKVETNKKLFQGVYLQNFGKGGSIACPMEMNLWKLQWEKILNALRSNYQHLDGCVLLQNGFMSDFRFQKQVMWLKNTLDWYYQTTTNR